MHQMKLESNGNTSEPKITKKEKILQNAGLKLRKIKEDGELHFPRWKPKPIVAMEVTNSSTDPEAEPLIASEDSNEVSSNNTEMNIGDPLPTVGRIVQCILLIFLVINVVVGYNTIQNPGGLLFLLPFITMNIFFAGLLYRQYLAELPVKIFIVSNWFKWLKLDKYCK